MKKKTAKEVIMHKFLASACKYQYFAQSQKKFARSHDRTTARFKNSGKKWARVLVLIVYQYLFVY